MEKNTLIKLIDLNYSTWRIAEELNTSQPNIRYWLRKHNLKTKALTNKETNQKKCPKCSLTKSKTEFYKSTKSSSFCKDCIKQTNKLNRLIAKQKAVTYKGGKCELCGYDKSLAALDFHHLDPTEKDPNWNSTRRHFSEECKKELDKCILLCANCHRETHNTDYL